MSVKRISDKIEKALNEQITKEAEAAQVYLAYGSWADNEGFPGVSEFFYGHCEEEREHMQKIIDYVNIRGGKAKIDAISAPAKMPKDVQDCIKLALKNEIKNSNAIHELVNLAHEEKDWATFNFLQWFVQEQIEEEALIMDLMDKYELATNDDDSDKNANLYELDKDLSKASQHIDTP